MRQTRSFRISLSKPKRRAVEVVFAAMGIALLAWLPIGAQSGTGQTRPTFPQPIGQPVGGIDESPMGSEPDNEKLLRALNADRQRSMVADTNKLLRLVSELNAEIVGTNPDSLTPEQLRKVAEIEKLAHSVKDKMSTSVRGTTPYMQPHFPIR